MTPYKPRWAPISTQGAFFNSSSPSQTYSYVPDIEFRPEQVLFDPFGSIAPPEASQLPYPPIPSRKTVDIRSPSDSSESPSDSSSSESSEDDRRPKKRAKKTKKKKKGKKKGTR